jgi:hypothetical protein
MQASVNKSPQRTDERESKERVGVEASVEPQTTLY